MWMKHKRENSSGSEAGQSWGISVWRRCEWSTRERVRSGSEAGGQSWWISVWRRSEWSTRERVSSGSEAGQSWGISVAGFGPICQHRANGNWVGPLSDRGEHEITSFLSSNTSTSESVKIILFYRIDIYFLKSDDVYMLLWVQNYIPPKNISSSSFVIYHDGKISKIWIFFGGKFWNKITIIHESHIRL